MIKKAITDLRSTFENAVHRAVHRDIGTVASTVDLVEVEIDYLELGPDGPGRMSGFAQISIGVDLDEGLAGYLTDICRHAEDVLIRQLGARSSLPTEVHISWDRPLAPPRFTAVRS